MGKAHQKTISIIFSQVAFIAALDKTIKSKEVEQKNEVFFIFYFIFFILSKAFLFKYLITFPAAL